MTVATRLGSDVALEPARLGGDARRGPRRALLLAVGVALVIGTVLRFWTRSHLWLDEALTVHIAELPLRRIPGALDHDGAPPLYYLLLHLWMRAFGTSRLAVRSMGGVTSVLSLPVMWLAARRLAAVAGLDENEEIALAWAAVLLLASSPFAVHFATEARMYSLVVLLVLVGYLVLNDVLAGTGHPVGSAVALAIVSGLLLLSHYWSIYLLLVVGAALVVGAWRARSAAARRRRLRAVVSIAAGGVLFLPWLPSFAHQLAHTGTPWSEPASFSAMVNAVSEFAGGRSSSGRALGLLFFALAGFGLCGTAIDRARVEVDLRTRPRGRGLALVTAGTLALAIAIGLLTGGAFSARYTSVVFPVFVLLVALGTAVLVDRRVRSGVVAAAVVLGLVTSTGNVTTDRTQLGSLVATARQAGLRDGDVIAYCPDQLGPAGTELAPPGTPQVGFPTLGDARFVDWVDYAQRNARADPATFARTVSDLAGPHAVWLVWAPEYRTFGTLCEQVVQQMGALRPPANQLVASDPLRYFEHANLVRYPTR